MNFLFTRLLPGMCCLLVLHGAYASGRWQEQLPNAQLLGAGDFRFFGVPVYSAQLWSTTPQLTVRAPYALQLRYHRSISRERLVQTSLDEMRRLGVEAPTQTEWVEWRQALQRSFVDVQPDDVITGVFLPDRGVQFYVGERAQQEILDPSFAQAFFAIWLDPQTRAPALREQLLGIALP